MKTPDNTDPWEDLFRKRFDDYQAEPAPNALDRILAAGNLGDATPRQPATGFRWLGLSMVSLLLLVLGGLFIRKETTPINQLQQNRSRPLESQSTEIASSKRSMPQGRGPLLIQPDQFVSEAQQPADAPLTGSAATPTVITTIPATLSEKTTFRNRKATSSGSVKEVVVTTAHHSQHERQTKDGVVAKKAGRLLNSIPEKHLTQAISSAEMITRLAQKTSERRVVGGMGTEKNIGHEQEQIVASDNLFWSTIARKNTSLLPRNFRMPTVTVAPMAPEQSHNSHKPSWIVALMPMYTFRQITPNTTDGVYVRQVNPTGTFSTDRVGWRLQAGLEWPLSKKLSLRTALVYSQLQQTVQYAIRPSKQDSVTVELVDEQTIRLTPVFADQVKTQTNTWHYAGLSADILWRVGSGKTWQYYLTAGASGGAYVGPVKHVSGFYQASFGMERLVSNGLWLRVEPSLQYGWNAVTDHKNLFLIRPYTYGLTIGLRH